MSPPQMSTSSSLAGLRRSFPELRGLTEARTLEVLGQALKGNARGVNQLIGAAGDYAQERGAGPVRLGSSNTWVHRAADGRTQVWHRQPTAAEVRACVGAEDPVPRAARAQRTTNKAPAKPKSQHAARVGRLFR